MARVISKPAGAIVALLSLSWVAAGCAVDQPNLQTLRSGPSIAGSQTGCETCISFSEITVLGEAGGPAAFDSDRLFALSDSLGRRFVYSEFGTEISVFDDTGELVGQVGRRGAGPGEFNMIASASVEPDGTLHVLDYLLARHTTFAPSLELVGSRTLEIRPDPGTLVLPDGESLLIPARMPDPATGSLLLHLTGSDGKVQRSFGHIAGESFEQGSSTMRALALSGDTAVWVAHPSRYRIDLWDLRAHEEPILTIERQVPWFPLGLQDGPTIENPPPPRVTDLQATDDGRLITSIGVPDPNWASAIEYAPSGEKRITDLDRYFDTIVEVLDPVGGTVEATVRRPELLRKFAGRGVFTVVTLDQGLIPRVRLLEAHLDQ